jgi:UDP-3-O-[3-hydroxymyristoyl] glucosamine N-acyltransferase
MHFTAPQTVSAISLVEYIGDETARVITGKKMTLSGVAPLGEAAPDTLSFYNGNPNRAANLFELPVGSVIVAKDQGRGEFGAPRNWPEDVALIVTSNPRRWFFQAVRHLFGDPERMRTGVHPLSNVEEGAQVDDTAWIGPFVTVSSGARIGAGAVLQHGVIIGENVSVGERTLVRANSVLGVPGQAVERDHNDRQILLPHLASIMVDEDVIIGAQSVIVRGSLNDTLIGKGTMIGNHVNIGHNCKIGAECFIGPRTVIAGSAHIGDRSWVAPGCTLLNKVKVGRNVMIGLGSVVMKPIPDNVYVLGSPAKEMPKMNRYNL